MLANGSTPRLGGSFTATTHVFLGTLTIDVDAKPKRAETRVGKLMRELFGRGRLDGYRTRLRLQAGSVSRDVH